MTLSTRAIVLFVGLIAMALLKEAGLRAPATSSSFLNPHRNLRQHDDKNKKELKPPKKLDEIDLPSQYSKITFLSEQGGEEGDDNSDAFIVMSVVATLEEAGKIQEDIAGETDMEEIFKKLSGGKEPSKVFKDLSKKIKDGNNGNSKKNGDNTGNGVITRYSPLAERDTNEVPSYIQDLVNNVPEGIRDMVVDEPVTEEEARGGGRRTRELSVWGEWPWPMTVDYWVSVFCRNDSTAWCWPYLRGYNDGTVLVSESSPTFTSWFYPKGVFGLQTLEYTTCWDTTCYLWGMWPYLCEKCNTFTYVDHEFVPPNHVAFFQILSYEHLWKKFWRFIFYQNPNVPLYYYYMVSCCWFG